MALTGEQVRGLASHIGYGNPAAPLWFVGSEEGLGGRMSAADQQANLAARSRWCPVMDMGNAHWELREDGAHIRDLIRRSGSTQVWRYMARIARAYYGAPDYNDPEAAAEYVRSRLGRLNGETFLTELDPFPSARAQQPVELRDFADSELVERTWEERAREQVRIFQEFRPKLVICYAPRLAERFERRFSWKWRPFVVLEWLSPASRTQRKLTRIAAIDYHAGTTGTAVLTPFFGQGQLSAVAIKQLVETAEFQAARA